MPATRMTTGTSTGGGIARRNSSTGSVSARNRGLAPIATPSAMPAHNATVYPTASRARLGATSSSSRRPNQVSRNAARIRASGGR